ncbi:odorant receptor 43a-like isoform X2 [Coccinella septempunctata]|uniref:odorant receptor 43a-like isoform X2 n=1 Tax=Coccinella septempunctata TaxID=41139 RepID=UPI001D06B428|nr:odorant receptor 43a-like isoform X2 [Coccinella septempunctata]
MTCCEKVVDTIWKINNPKRGRPKNFDRITSKMEFLTTFVHHYVFCISASYVIFFVFWDTECKSKKLFKTEDSFGYVCGVPTPAWFPFELDSILWKCFFIVCNIVNLVYVLPRGAVMIILFYGFIVFTVDRIEHLRLIVKQMDPQRKGKRVAEILEYCINNYTEITLLVKDINGTIGVIFASTQNGLVILIVAALEYQAIMENNLIALFALTLWILIQAVACKCGQLLEDASTRLKEEIYNIPWYKMNSTLQKDFKIFHAQVQRGFYLKMKPSILMNMEYFRQVINKSYSFLMFLTNLERVE